MFGKGVSRGVAASPHSHTAPLSCRGWSLSPRHRVAFAHFRLGEISLKLLWVAAGLEHPGEEVRVELGGPAASLAVGLR